MKNTAHRGLEDQYMKSKEHHTKIQDGKVQPLKVAVSLEEKKKSIYDEFRERNKDNLIPAIEKEIERVILTTEPKRASKIILELVWICRKEIMELDNG